MKRTQMIVRLVEVGRNEKKLKQLSNTELEAAMLKEREALAQVAEARALHAAEVNKARLDRERQQKREQIANLKEAERLAADKKRASQFQYRPLPPIGPIRGALDGLPGFARQSRMLDLRNRFRMAQERFMKLGRVNGAKYADEANSALRELRKLEVMA